MYQFRERRILQAQTVVKLPLYGCVCLDSVKFKRPQYLHDCIQCLAYITLSLQSNLMLSITALQ